MLDGIFVPNPCEHVMFDHMRYRSGQVVPQTVAGSFTVDQLDLNDSDAIDWRKSFISGLGVIAGAVKAARATVKQVQKLLVSARTAKEKAKLQGELATAKSNLAKAEQTLKGLAG